MIDYIIAEDGELYLDHECVYLPELVGKFTKYPMGDFKADAKCRVCNNKTVIDLYFDGRRLETR